MQIINLNSPDISVMETKAVLPQISFESFLNKFKSTLKTVFHEDHNIDQFSVQRGMPDEVLQKIMLCNPNSLCIPKEYGGRGGNVQQNLALLSAASYESLSLSLTLGINSALFLQPVIKYGQEDIKPGVFDRFLNHQNMGGLMITEPGFGSDALNMQTSFTEEDKHFHLKGTKHWAGLTGQADFWVLTARRLAPNGGLQRDVDLFVCDNSAQDQKIIVDEKFENLGLYQIPYGRNILDVKIPKLQRLVPKTTGVQMLLDLLHRSRMQFPGMALGFVKRMLDEAIMHCQQRMVGGKNLFSYDQVQQHLARLQANYTIVSALCTKSSEIAGIQNDLTPLGFEANIIKTVSSDLMQESAQIVVQLVGAAAYKLNHVAGRGIVDSRPFQIFEGSNDILYNQITESLLKQMKTAKESHVFSFLKEHAMTSNAALFLKELLNFEINTQMSQRKFVEFGKALSRIATLDLVVRLGESGFRNDMIENAISIIKQEVTQLMANFNYAQNAIVVPDYETGSDWSEFVIA
ncbi:MAG: acyl-CoA/acyl-ACP dehydrogenase [Paludibacter sp.]|nr:acyl-CoA/acyl-ACP dehydrogenase [Paludibacter sp.]